MPTFEELDAQTSKQLHDKAQLAALKRLDVHFFLKLLSTVPIAEAMAGHQEESNEDVVYLSKRLHDAVHADEGELADALRPLYIDYLLEHEH